MHKLDMVDHGSKQRPDARNFCLTKQNVLFVKLIKHQKFPDVSWTGF